MGRYVEKEGKTIDEAIVIALEELDIDEENAEIEILDEGNRGLLGFIGNRLAKVRVTEKICNKDIILGFLNPIFEKMRIDAIIDIQEDEEKIQIQLSGEDIGIVIGRRGETLDALQYLISLIVNKHEDQYKRVELDVSNYRKKREETLINLAKRLAERVSKTRKNVTLEPMNPYERRIIHSTLQGYKYVDTYSVGEEPNRRVVIRLKQNRVPSASRYEGR